MGPRETILGFVIEKKLVGDAPYVYIVPEDQNLHSFYFQVHVNAVYGLSNLLAKLQPTRQGKKNNFKPFENTKLAKGAINMPVCLS